MNVKKIITVLSALFLTAGFTTAEVPSVEKMYGIMEAVQEAYNFNEDFMCIVSHIIEKPGEPKEAAQYKFFRRDFKDQTCIVQLAPEADKGTGYLQEKNNLWTYDPYSHQFTHSSLKKTIGSSDTKASDLTKRGKFKDEYQILSVEESKVGKFEVYAVLTKTLRSDAVYAQEKFFVRKDNNLVLKIENYGASGRLMRTNFFPKYVKVKQYNIPMHQIFINEIKKGEKTTQILADFEITAIPDVVFTKAYLEKIN